MQAVYLPFAVESMVGLSESAQQLLREIHLSASTHCTWRDADTIGSHLLDSVSIAVQRYTGMALCIRHGHIVSLSSQQYQALRTSVNRETTRALGASAA